ncbi:MAG: ABC transporter ATP-binding protein/permease [Saccharofermentans sp.]|nr:ABC transporter ATP-binding protein/permease [Saccharofermentans sp.]
MRKFDMKLIRRFGGFLKGSGNKIMISIITAVLSSGIGIVLPFLFGKAIDTISDNGIDYDLLGRYIVAMIVLIVISSVFQLFMNRTNNKIAYDVTEKIRNEAYGKVRKLPIAYIDNTSAGTIQSMVISDCETIGDGLVMFMNQFFTGITAIVFTLAIMLFSDWKISLFVLVFTPVSFLVSYFIASRSFSSFKAQSEIRGRQTSFISEGTGNFRIIHLFNINEMICSEFDRINEDYKRTSRKATFLSSITNPSTRFVNALIYAGVAFIGAGHVMSGIITVGVLTSLLAYSKQFMQPFNDLSSVYTELSDSMACLTRIFSYLDEAELDDDLSSEDINDDTTWDREGDFEIEFRDVSFSYVKDQPVIKNVSFKIMPGSSCAIVGPTGCGKTTLINLLLRFYEPDSGEILVNGTPISQVPRNTLRKYLGVVTQDTWFRNSDIMENIKFGRPLLTDEDAIKTAKVSGADSFIRKLPDKYHEKIVSSRDDISEGQRQLLSITRAMASDPCILILDEATSSVDILTEVKIQKAVKDLLKGRTSLIIAHRLSTIVDADMIVVMEDGKVSEIGKHEDMINSGGFYSKLYKSYTE